jgi:hypothetical protein
LRSAPQSQNMSDLPSIVQLEKLQLFKQEANYREYSYKQLVQKHK